MTLKEIRKERKKLEARIGALKRQVELVQLELRHLEGQCEHPKGYGYTDYGGFCSYHCPDCGLDR